MSERYSDDADWATAAEQSSEEDEAQEGNVLAEEELSVTPAEHVAVHVEDEDGEEDDTVDTDIDIDDPEAAAIVNDALNLDEAAESEAAAEVLNESVAEEVAEQEAEAADEVTPYDGPELGADDARVAQAIVAGTLLSGLVVLLVFLASALLEVPP